MKQKTVSAAAMSFAVRFDAQLALPVRPKLLEGLVKVELPDGLLFEGTGEQQVLKGKATKTLLPRLLPLLDGSRDLAQLQSCLPGVPFAHLHGALSLLFTRGLLEDYAGAPAIEGRTDAATYSYLRRHVDATRVNRSAAEAYRRMRETRVFLYAAGPAAAQASGLVAEQLRRSGIPDVFPCAWEQTSAARPERGRKALVLALVAGEDAHDRLAELDDRCAGLSIPWLRAAYVPRGATAELGPYFQRGETCCYRCFARAETADETAPDSHPEEEALRVRLWANMVALEAISLLSRIIPSASGQQTIRYSFETWETQRLRYPKLPGCARCRPDTHGSPDEWGLVASATVYEDMVAFPSRALLEPKAHQAHYKASNLDLATEGKRYPAAPAIPLPPQDTLPRAQGATRDHLPGGRGPSQRAESLSTAMMARVLSFGAGILHSGNGVAGKLQRWSPTGGNLGSVEVYLAARKVEGLPAGLYFYQPHEHVLASLETRGGREPLDEFLARALAVEPGDLPDAAVFTVAALHRVMRKYGPFGYRIVHLDAGVALAQMRMAASGLGLRAELPPSWSDDEIGASLEVDGLHEVLTGVLCISAGEAKPAAVRIADTDKWAPAPGLRDVRALGPLQLHSVARILCEESRRTHCSGERGPADGEAEPETEVSYELTPPEPPEKSFALRHVMPARRSVRLYSSEPVSMSALTAMLQCAREGDRQDWPAETRATRLRLFFWAWRVEGLAPGVYEYGESGRAIPAGSAPDVTLDGPDLFLQIEYCSAPLVIVIAGDLEAACAARGSWGHRQLLLRAGAASQRLWFTALSLGLQGSAFAGLLPGAARRFAGLDGNCRAALFAFSAGHIREQLPEGL